MPRWTGSQQNLTITAPDMSVLKGLCGLCGSRNDYDDADNDQAAERRPLLADYGGGGDGSATTTRQQRLHAKLHSYQILRALAAGYLPSTEQAVANLRTLLAADVFAGDGEAVYDRLSPSGRVLVRLARRWLEQLIVLAEHKNGGDAVQAFVWSVTRVEVGVDVDMPQLPKGPTASSAYRSLQTVGSLLLTNAPFRLFLADLTDVGRDVFRDTALALAEASQEAAENVEQPRDAGEAAPPVDKATDNAANTAVDTAASQIAGIAGEVASGATKVAAGAQQSVAGRLVDNDDGARERLLGRLREAVGSLQQRPDYATSVSVLTRLLQQYAAQYVRAAESVVDEVVEAVEERVDGHDGGGPDGRQAVQTNDEADEVLRSVWSFVTAFGQPEAWRRLEARFKALLDCLRSSSGDDNDDNDKSDNAAAARADALMRDLGSTLEAMLTDPAFYDADGIEARLAALRAQAVASLGDGSRDTLDACDALMTQAQATLQAVADDRDVAALADTTARIADLLWPAPSTANSMGFLNADLVGDAVGVFVPWLVQALRYVPIPRLEVITPDIDLLLESLVLEPGRPPPPSPGRSSSSPQQASFLPNRLQIQIRNDVDIRRATATDRSALAPSLASSLETAATIHIRGLSVAADDVGYVAHLHPDASSTRALLTLLRLRRLRGLAAVHLDARGIDVRLDVAVVRDAAATLLALRGVDVRVHRLDFALQPVADNDRPSRLSAWGLRLLRPLVRPIVQKTLERQLAAALTDALHALNQELVFARERLRAARIAAGGAGAGDHSPAATLQSLPAIVRAVTSRFQPPRSPHADDADTHVSFGLFGDGGSGDGNGNGVFDGVYAPGSLVRVWREGARAARRDRIDARVRGGWCNAVFDVPTADGVNG